MVDIFTLPVVFFVVAMFFLSAIFFLEIVAACFYNFTKKISETVPVPDLSEQYSTAFLIPAHNEEAVIFSTLQSIIPQLKEGDEIIVVADNCQDSTAEIARECMAITLVRRDELLRGKGYALDFGVSYLKSKSFDVVIIVDADCILEPGSRDVLVAAAMYRNKPIQALYLMRNVGDNLSVPKKISEFSWVVKNKIRPLGLLAIGGPCQLMGTGMAFPTKILVDAQLASGCVVEDMKLGLDLAIANQAPEFSPDALVSSDFPTDEIVGQGQRTRWVHGHLEMIFFYGPKLLFSAIKGRNLNSLLMALDLMVFPLVMLLSLNLLGFVLSLAALILLGSSIWMLSALSLILFAVALMLSWFLEGKNILSLKDVFFGGLHLLKKFSLYTKFVTNRKKDWNKTARK